MCAKIAAEKKAENIVAIDLRGISSFTDFYVICSGSSEPQLKAIANEMQGVVKKEHGIRTEAVDGFPMSQWVVVDFPGVMVHVFQTSKRELYRLEELWNDAPRLKLEA